MKKILVSQRVDMISSYGERRDALDQRWFSLLDSLGLIGFPVPNNPPVLSKIIKTVDFDGVLLTGGETPAIYGGKALDRDETDRALITYAIGKGLPIFGVCRGMQSILLYFGGSLKEAPGHIRTMHRVFGLYSSVVNSFHSLIPHTLPMDITAIFKTEDGTVEGIRHRLMPITGIMWHPEREPVLSERDLQLIRKSFLLE
ncbi:MAG: gamma-glutamyl-gamma-aminobutyrate hydrolase family protein [Clostridiales bacterium]|nr:gamma-glutamyl-gamma-aminobutyrate hydrolase family protein [Clostridiales bacterium]